MTHFDVLSQEVTPCGTGDGAPRRRPGPDIREAARLLRIWRGSRRRMGYAVLASPGGAGCARTLRAAAALSEGEGLDWATGRARERAPLALEPLADASRTLLGIARARARQGEPAWEAHWDRTIVELAPALSAILPDFDWGRVVKRAPTLRPRLARGRLLDSVVRLLLRHAALAPTVLVIENVDRADKGTLGVVERLVEAPSRFLRRPESRARLLLWVTWASDEAAPPELEPLMAAFRPVSTDSEDREDAERAWRHSLHDLAAGSRRVLQALVVLCRPYSVERIAAAMSSSVAFVREELEALDAGDWLRWHPDGGVELEDRLAASVVRASMGADEVHALEGACVWNLLSAEGESPSPFVLLSHLDDSGSWAIYQGYARQACETAESLGFPEEAIPHARRIVELAAEHGQPVPLDDAERLARLLEATGREGEAVRAYEAWLRQDDVSPRARARACRRLGELFGRLGDRSGQLAALEQGLSELEGEGESVERLAIFAELARIALYRADLRDSLHWCEAGAKLAELDGLDRDPEFREILRLTREVHMRRGEYVEAEAFEIRRLAAARRAGDVLEVLESLENLSELGMARGVIEEAEARASEALQIASQTGARYLTARAQVRLARIRCRRDGESEALEGLQQAQATLLELGEDLDRVSVSDSLAVLALVRGEYRRGAEALRESARNRRWSDSSVNEGAFPFRGCRSASDRAAEIRFHEAELRRALLGGDARKERENRLALGDLELEAGVLESALASYQAGVRTADTGKDPRVSGRFWVRLARVARLQGNGSQATAFLSEALDCAASAEGRGVVGAAYVEAGLLFLREAKIAKAIRYLARGIEIFRDEEDALGSFEATLAISRLLTEIGASQAGAIAAIAALESAESQGFDGLSIRAHLAAARAFRCGGAREEGDSHLHRAAAIAASLAPRLECAEIALEEAWAALQAEDLGRTHEKGKRALLEARGIGAGDLAAEAQHVLGCCSGEPQNRAYDFVGAHESLKAARSAAEGRPIFRAQVASSLARLYGLRGQEEVASRWIEEVATLLRSVLAGAPEAASRQLIAREEFAGLRDGIGLPSRP